jgi:hypothetical protein
LDLRPFAGTLLGPLGLDAEFAWFLVDVKKNRLQSSARGDVDILAGRLEWANPEDFKTLLEKEMKAKEVWHPSQIAFLTAITLASTGGIKWPPPTDWLVAIEAKCGYLSPEADSVSPANFKSLKASPQKVRRVRVQVKKLLKLGFDRVALLDVIANPPVSGPGGQAWLTAADLADCSRQAVWPVLEERLPPASPAGHYVWSIGAVVGGDEGRRGAGSPVELRAARDNPLLSRDSQVREHRREVEENLGKLLARLPKPLNLRVIFSDCPVCGQIHPDGNTCGV